MTSSNNDFQQKFISRLVKEKGGRVNALTLEFMLEVGRETTRQSKINSKVMEATDEAGRLLVNWAQAGRAEDIKKLDLVGATNRASYASAWFSPKDSTEPERLIYPTVVHGDQAAEYIETISP